MDIIQLVIIVLGFALLIVVVIPLLIKRKLNKKGITTIRKRYQSKNKKSTDESFFEYMTKT